LAQNRIGRLGSFCPLNIAAIVESNEQSHAVAILPPLKLPNATEQAARQERAI
jgi:hypothetical protein